MSSTYRSAQGKIVDMARIRAKNENVRAIGNMKVNAKGDLLDSDNNIVEQSSQRVNRVYNQRVVNPTSQTKPAETTAQTQPAVKPQVPVNRQAAAIASRPVTPEIVSEPPPVIFLEDMTADEIAFFNEMDKEDIPEKTETKNKKK